jgi:hypothetical protein
VPVRLKIDERDDMIVLVNGDQDQAAVAGSLMLLRRIQRSGNPCGHLSDRVVRESYFASRTVEDVGRTGGIALVIGTDSYLHSAHRPPYTHILIHHFHSNLNSFSLNSV